MQTSGICHLRTGPSISKFCSWVFLWGSTLIWCDCLGRKPHTRYAIFASIHENKKQQQDSKESTAYLMAQPNYIVDEACDVEVCDDAISTPSICYCSSHIGMEGQWSYHTTPPSHQQLQKMIGIYYHFRFLPCFITLLFTVLMACAYHTASFTTWRQCMSEKQTFVNNLLIRMNFHYSHTLLTQHYMVICLMVSLLM